MRQFLLFVVFDVLLVALGFVAAYPVDAPYVAGLSGAPARIEAELQVLAERALAVRGFNWASVEMDGQIGVLHGEAPREEERAEAIAALRTATGGGGWIRGGVMAVRDQTSIAAPISPYVWRAVRSGDRVTLAGAAPTRAARAELVAYAGELYSGGADDQMIIARGAPDEIAWIAVARTAIAQLAALNDGSATLRDERLTIEGVAENAVARDRVTAALAHLPDPFLAAARVEAPELGAGAADAVPGDDADMETISDLDVCRDVFATLLAEGGDVDFAEGETAIAKESYPLLDRLAIAALRCEEARVSIEAGGEPSSDADAFVSLGSRRAQAVADYFILKGVSQERLDAAGRSRDASGSAERSVSFAVNF